MKFIEVPKFKDDGSIEAMVVISPEEAKDLLTFSINFLANAGGKFLNIMEAAKDELSADDGPREFND